MRDSRREDFLVECPTRIRVGALTVTAVGILALIKEMEITWLHNRLIPVTKVLEEHGEPSARDMPAPIAP